MAVDADGAFAVNHGRDALRVDRADVRSTDPDEVAEHLTRTLGTPVTVTVDSTAGTFADVRASFGSVALHRIATEGTARIAVPHTARSVVGWLLAGSGEVTTAGAHRDVATGDVVLIPAGATPVTACLSDATLVLLSIESTVAGERLDALPPGVRLPSSSTPASPDLARVWKETVGFVRETVLAAGDPGPVLLRAAERLLVATTLSVFPYAVDREAPTADTASALPPLLQRAMGFIEHNAHRDIGVDDIAAAVFVTPRRVQALFKEHLATTPTGYLRDVRLRRAHRDLLHSEHTTTTVGAVAARWRFAHTGRFAVTYRRVFGESPRETLRRYP